MDSPVTAYVDVEPEETFGRYEWSCGPYDFCDDSFTSFTGEGAGGDSTDGSTAGGGVTGGAGLGVGGTSSGVSPVAVAGVAVVGGAATSGPAVVGLGVALVVYTVWDHWDNIEKSARRLGDVLASLLATRAEPSDWPDFRDPTRAPGPDWEWRGGKNGAWWKEGTKESLRPDTAHGPYGPHWDWTVRGQGSYRVCPDGRIEPK